MALERLGRPYIFALASLCLAGMGIWAIFEEGEIYLRAGTSEIARLSATIDVGRAAGFSTLTERLALLDCSAVLTSLDSAEMQEQPKELRDAVVPHCLLAADQIVAASPTNAFAWYVGALAATLQQDWSGFNMRVARAQVVDRTEQWVGQQRVALVENNYANADATSKAGNDADLRMLLGSIPGQHAIASRYWSDAAFRDRITAMVDTLPEATQKRFVSVVRAEMPR